jgi:hypothetical protein
VAVTQSVRVEMNAFAIVTSTATPKGGGSLTVTATTAESLSGSPRLYVTQPGVATWGVTMTKVDSRTWRVTVKTSTGHPAGALSLKVWARDADGRTQATIRTLALS